MAIERALRGIRSRFGGTARCLCFRLRDTEERTDSHSVLNEGSFPFGLKPSLSLVKHLFQLRNQQRIH